MVSDKVRAENKRLAEKERELAQQFHYMTLELPLDERRDQADAIIESLKMYFNLALRDDNKPKPKHLRRVK